MKDLKITERGWAGHFICADRCKYRRNTLVEYGDKKVVVSTVGNYDPQRVIGYKAPKGLPKDFDRQIGCDRYYETMAFHATFDGTYWDADVSKSFEFSSNWAIAKLTHETDKDAEEMHQAVVKEVCELLANPPSPSSESGSKEV